MKAPASSQKEIFLSSGNSSVIDEKVLKDELLLSEFVSEPNLPIATAGHVGKLFKVTLPDSKL